MKPLILSNQRPPARVERVVLGDNHRPLDVSAYAAHERPGAFESRLPSHDTGRPNERDVRALARLTGLDPDAACARLRGSAS